MLKIFQLENEPINDESLVQVKQMNNIYEFCYCEHRNNKAFIRLLDKDNYVVLATGEVKKCEHIENRSENKNQVAQSLKRLRDYINTNVVEPSHCKWITLTYKENMQDTKRLYLDFKNFIKRFKYNYGNFEYIVAREPQARGSWHCHLIVIFDKKAPYINNKVVEDLWKQGFTKTQKLNDIDNVGAYLTAYLGDLELNDTNILELTEKGLDVSKMAIKTIDLESTKKNDKKFIKGGRLYLYPPKFNIYSISKGIKKPQLSYLSYHVAKEKAGLLAPTYSKTISLIDQENDFSNKIIYEYYNTKRK